MMKCQFWNKSSVKQDFDLKNRKILNIGLYLNEINFHWIRWLYFTTILVSIWSGNLSENKSNLPFTFCLFTFCHHGTLQLALSDDARVLNSYYQEKPDTKFYVAQSNVYQRRFIQTWGEQQCCIYGLTSSGKK